MRKIRGDNWWRQDAKNVPKGTCKTCAGAGRYKRTFKHKNPIITFCILCRGTGKVDIQVRYNGAGGSQLIKGDLYPIVSEGSDHYIIRRGRELEQMPKEWFDEAN